MLLSLLAGLFIRSGAASADEPLPDAAFAQKAAPAANEALDGEYSRLAGPQKWPAHQGPWVDPSHAETKRRNPIGAEVKWTGQTPEGFAYNVTAWVVLPSGVAPTINVKRKSLTFSPPASDSGGDSGDGHSVTYVDVMGHEHHIIETLMVEAKDGKTYKVACRPPAHTNTIADVTDNGEKVGTITGGDSFVTTPKYTRVDLYDVQQRFSKAGGGCRPPLQGHVQP